MSLTGLNLREKAKGFGSKDGSSKSSRGPPNLRMKGLDQIDSWMGKGPSKDKEREQGEHVSRPLSSLKDPASFGPPPKHINYHGPAALPNRITPDTSGLGAPLTQAEINANHRRMEEQEALGEEEHEEPPKPPTPYRADTTGLSTSNLPPPPGRLDVAGGRAPPVTAKPKPGLPPRLPPRQDSVSSVKSSASHAEPPSHYGILNQGSIDRLSTSGVSVPSLGVGAKPHPGLPPRNSTSPAFPEMPATAERPQLPAAAPGGNAQLNELQARFSRMGTSSPKPSSPSQGTTWAEKQAAVRTASAFRGDPSSVSFEDARNAASTANNFRERHGAQVASGWKAANALGAGAAAKFPHQPTSPVETSLYEEGPIVMQDNTIVKPKKAAPPPPKKKPGLSVHADAGQSPPPIPLASKPKPPAISAHPEQKDLDLDLQSLWFAKSPIQFPPPVIARLPGSRGYASSSGWSSDGVRQTYTFTGAIRHNTTLAMTKIHLTWDSSNPGVTVKAQQKHIPPPRSLTKQEVESYQYKYGDRIAAWCESRMGQQVGNGECWTLAADALSAIAEECRARREEPCMTSQGVVHGSLIFSSYPPQPSSPPDGVEAAGVARGDIVQFLSGHFKAKNGMSESWAGAPDHTAVVTGVDRGGIVRIVEQNAGGVKRVRESKYNFSELLGGEVRIFRPVGESWIGPLEATWP